MHMTILGTEVSVAWVCAMKMCTLGQQYEGELPETLILSLGELVESRGWRGEPSHLGRSSRPAHAL